MCRLYGFRATEPTKVECTLARAQNALLIQSRADRRGVSHTDGWGIGFYLDESPLVERRATAAHTDLAFSRTAERVYSRAVVAHVRRATVGGPLPENTHPFCHGPWLFAHNGTIAGFDAVGPRMAAEVRPELLAFRQGATDSEMALYWLLSRLERAGIPSHRPGVPAPALASVLADAVRTLDRWCAASGAPGAAKLNFVLTDGRSMVATRWNNTLCFVERAGVHDCEICGVPHVRHRPRTRYRAAVIASEPISGEEWREVPDHGLVSVDAALHVECRAL